MRLRGKERPYGMPVHGQMQRIPACETRGMPRLCPIPRPKQGIQHLAVQEISHETPHLSTLLVSARCWARAAPGDLTMPKL